MKNQESSFLYPRFTAKAEQLVEEFKETSYTRGPRRLCSVPSFALALAMSSRIRKHYTHAKWFKISELNTMLETHGAVGTEVYVIRSWGTNKENARSSFQTF